MLPWGNLLIKLKLTFKEGDKFSRIPCKDNFDEPRRRGKKIEGVSWVYKRVKWCEIMRIKEDNFEMIMMVMLVEQTLSYSNRFS